jgi:hypothetical protein
LTLGVADINMKERQDASIWRRNMSAMSSLGIDQLDVGQRLGLVREILSSIGTGSSVGATGSERRAFDALGQVIEITEEIFGVPVVVESDCDPEHPNEKYVRFCVEVADDTSTILARELEWARRMANIEPKWDAFRLSIKPKA